jgi:hypothetical protein
MAYHKHHERTFYINAITGIDEPPQRVRVDRREDTLFLNGSPVLSVRIHKDNTVEMHTAAMNIMDPGHYFNGFDVWRMLHDDEAPDEEYAGYLEAQLLGVRLLANMQNKEWIQHQTLGRDADELPE